MNFQLKNSTKLTQFAIGNISTEVHKQEITRMVQIGAKPIISLQYLLELQTDLIETYKAVIDLAVKYGGPYGIGIQYAREMLKH